jgi:capsule polysaccharide export protein KpsE/RkpR
VTRSATNSETILTPVDPGELAGAPTEIRAQRERMATRMRMLWDGRQLIFRAAAWAFATALAFAFLIPKRYTSIGRLMPPEESTGALAAMLAALNTRSTFVPTPKTTGALFTGVLESRTVQDALINKFNLRQVYRARTWEAARKTLSSRSSISLDPQNGIISIAVSDHSAERAAGMGREYINELDSVVTQLSTSAAHRERLFLEQRLEQVKQELEPAEKDFSRFASQNSAIDIKEQSRAMVTAAATLQGQLIAAESEAEGLRQIYTANNVRVRALQGRISELKHQLEKFGGAAAKESSGIETLYPPIRQLPLLGVTYADLYRKVRVQEEIFETLTQQYELAKVQEAREIPTVKVLDPPDVPETKSYPPRLLIAFLGTLLAFGGSTAWVVVRGYWGTMDAQDPGKVLLTEIFSTVKTSVSRSSANGSWIGAVHRRIQAATWSKLRRHNGPNT